MAINLIYNLGRYFMEIKLRNLEESKNFGISLGKLLKAGDILCLNGDLGAGKTTLSKYIGLGLGVEDYITSPTFNLIKEYKGRLTMYHFDVYRLEGVDDLYDLGFDEYFYGNGVCIIEWANKIQEILPEEKIVLDIEKGQDLDERLISIHGKGQTYEDIIKELKVK